MSTKFNTLSLSSEILQNLDNLSYFEMTPIQAKGLPFVLEGKDVIGQARTGSGKTACFGLGILSKLDEKKLIVQSLIMTPTRELAEQVSQEIRKLARFKQNIKVTTICGGTNEAHQIKSLDHGVHIIVGTPGRIYKFLKDGVISLKDINTFVLDEADRMLDMGFFESIRAISRYLPVKKQVLLFSATFPMSIKELSSEIQNDPELVKVDVSNDQDTISQKYFLLESHKEKKQLLVSVLAKYLPDSTIIFCKTKLICEEVLSVLKKSSISAMSIHGDHDQRDRTLVLTKFMNGSCSVLVATDVAARGLDIKDLSLVINYDLPSDPEVYVHRIGRTGREGKTGSAINFFIDQEDYKIKDIEEYTSTEITPTSISELEKINLSDFSLSPKMKTLFISGGKKDKLRPGDIVGAIVKNISIDPDMIGDINILNVFSYVALDSSVAQDVHDKLQSVKIKKRKFRVGWA